MSWLKRLKQGLSKTSTAIDGGIVEVVKRKIDTEALEELEELLIATDMGTDTAIKLVANIEEKYLGKKVTDTEIKESLAGDISYILEPLVEPLSITKGNLQVLLFIGVNGSGKTTTIGKLSQQLKSLGLNIRLVAGDTFRAGAIQQLQEWGKRADVPVHTTGEGKDAAALVHDAMEHAVRDNIDVLMIDTAGRLQNKNNLMEELGKMRRVIKRHVPKAPHHCILVLDATTGQAAHSQVKAFEDIAKVSGLIITKLDGTAKGGVVVAMANTFQLPIHAIGVGEKAEDLQPFDAGEYARQLVGIHS